MTREEGSACGGVGEKAWASRTPSQGCGGTGAANLRSPTGGAAKGIPLNVATACWYLPRTAPLLVLTTGSFTRLLAFFSSVYSPGGTMQVLNESAGSVGAIILLPIIRRTGISSQRS